MLVVGPVTFLHTYINNHTTSQLLVNYLLAKNYTGYMPSYLLDLADIWARRGYTYIINTNLRWYYMYSVCVVRNAGF